MKNKIYEFGNLTFIRIGGCGRLNGFKYNLFSNHTSCFQLNNIQTIYIKPYVLPKEVKKSNI